MTAVWDSPSARWDDPNVTWDGAAVGGATATLQSVATITARPTVNVRSGVATLQSIAYVFATGAKVLRPATTLQSVATLTANATLHTGGAQAAEATLQSVATLTADPEVQRNAQATLQSVATLTATASGQMFHHAEAFLQIVASLSADPTIGQPPSGEWYIRGGGSFYPAPTNRRKRLAGTQGRGRRIG